MLERKFIIAFDFDGTIVEDNYPLVGQFKPNAKEVLTRLAQSGKYEFVLWTCRSEWRLQKAIEFLYMNNLLTYFTAINENVPYIKEKFAEQGSISPKIFADVYIDDKILNSNINWLDIQQKINELQKKKMFQNI